MNNIIIGNYERISKSQARKLFDNGETIGLIACKMNVLSPYQPPLIVNSKELETTFEKLVNTFTYYNCSYEMGYYIHYFKIKGE